jgi:hypothetical protein
MRSVISLLIGIFQQCSQTSESRVEKQTRDSLSSFYRLHPQEFLESVIDVAFGDNPPEVSRWAAATFSLLTTVHQNALTIIDLVAESAHQVVELISSAVSRRLTGTDDQRKRNVSLT